MIRREYNSLSFRSAHKGDRGGHSHKKETVLSAHVANSQMDLDLSNCKLRPHFVDVGPLFIEGWSSLVEL